MNDILTEIETRLKIFPGLYEVIRLVDPTTKRPSYPQDDPINQSQHPGHCFSIWQNGTPCANCIAMRAKNTGQPAHKIELHGEQAVLVQAQPVFLAGEFHIVELIQQIDASMLLLRDNRKEINLRDFIDKLNYQVVIDELTGLYNRRYIEEKLPAQLHLATQTAGPLCVVMADIDNFKEVNDSYGHLAGDAALQKVSAIMIEQLAPFNGWAARYGGDEFLIVLEIPLPQALEQIEKIRSKIETAICEYEGYRIKVTCSFGIEMGAPDEHDYRVLINSVDNRLYQAKKSGRNRSISD